MVATNARLIFFMYVRDFDGTNELYFLLFCVRTHDPYKFREILTVNFDIDFFMEPKSK